MAANPNRAAVAYAGIVLAFRSMSLFRLGRQVEAREALQQAENFLAKPLKNLTGGLWYRLAFAQTALEEAQTVIRPDEGPHTTTK